MLQVAVGDCRRVAGGGGSGKSGVRGLGLLSSIFSLLASCDVSSALCCGWEASVLPKMNTELSYLYTTPNGQLLSFSFLVLSIIGPLHRGGYEQSYEFPCEFRKSADGNGRVQSYQATATGRGSSFVSWVAAAAASSGMSGAHSCCSARPLPCCSVALSGSSWTVTCAAALPLPLCLRAGNTSSARRREEPRAGAPRSPSSRSLLDSASHQRSKHKHG